MFRGEWIDKTTNALQSFPNSKREFCFLSQPYVFWRVCKCLLPWSLQSQRRTHFLQFLMLFSSWVDKKLLHSSSSWLLFQCLSRYFLRPSLRYIPMDYFLLPALHLCTQPSPSTSCPHSASQVRAASKISKTEEGVNEWPTVTSEEICSIKKRGFYAVRASYTERDRHHGNKLVRQEQGTTLGWTITGDIISGGETSKALEFGFLLHPESHLLLWNLNLQSTSLAWDNNSRLGCWMHPE